MNFQRGDDRTRTCLFSSSSLSCSKMMGDDSQNETKQAVAPLTATAAILVSEFTVQFVTGVLPLGFRGNGQEWRARTQLEDIQHRGRI